MGVVSGNRLSQPDRGILVNFLSSAVHPPFGLGIVSGAFVVYPTYKSSLFIAILLLYLLIGSLRVVSEKILREDEYMKERDKPSGVGVSVTIETPM